MKPIIKTKDEVDISRISGFLGTAYNDYISARILFNKNKLIQACILSNYAIEKSIKALILASGKKVPKTHDLTKLLPFLKHDYEKLYSKICVSFFMELSKIFKVRYRDEVEVGYNFVIIQSKYLAELDYTFSLFEPVLRIQNIDGDNKTNYELAKENKEDDLWIRNYVLNGINKVDFVKKLCHIHELRRLPNMVYIEIIYLSEEIEADENFTYKALSYTDDLKNFTASHKVKEKTNELQ